MSTNSLCENDLRRLGAEAPNELIRLIESLEPPRIPDGLLTFALEELGRSGSDRAVAVLAAHASHDSSRVREGVVYGLAATRRPEAAECLARMAREDASPCVRDAAAAALESLVDRGPDPAIISGLAPDFTGDISSEEYPRERWK